MRAKIKDIEFDVPMPTLEALTTALRNGAIADQGQQNPVAVKAFCEACLPKPLFKELKAKAPACWITLGGVILMNASGGSRPDQYELQELVDPETDDMPDDVAEAYRKNAETSAALYGDGDPQRELYVVRYVVQKEDRFAILRFPKEVEIDSYERARSFEAAKTLAIKICVFGDMKALEKDAPALYLYFATFARQKAGSASIQLLGE